MPSPSVSVVIPTRNRAQYITKALDSVFAQTFTDYEVIVVDDGSSDTTQQILAPYIREKKIQYQFQEPSGVSAARNRGVRLAKAAYIAFLDSDDIFMPIKLEKQMYLFRDDPQLGFVHCSFSKFDDQGQDLGVRDTSRFRGRIYPQMLHEWSVLMAMPCMLMRTEAILEVGGFDERMVWAEDLDLWRRIARRFAVGVVAEPLVRVRVHSGSTSFDRGKGAVGFERYLKKAFDEDPGLSAIFKRQAKGLMHAKLGQNLLGEGGLQEMHQVRRHCLIALTAWPLQLDAFVGLIASWLPRGLRRRMVAWLRQRRYPSTKVEPL
ncbi:MAG: glycosyltransferase family A protein [Anaerolineales bacterium]